MGSPKIDMQSKGWASAAKSFAQWIERETGYVFDDGNSYQLWHRLQSLVDQFACSDPSAFVMLLQRPSKEQRDVIVDIVVNNETYFFREPWTFSSFTDVWLPYFQERHTTCLKIWSCACSSGQELYTLAILLEEYRSANSTGLNYSGLGSDICTQAIAKAQSGSYTPLEVDRGLPLDLRYKYFDPSGDCYVAKARLKEKISFLVGSAVDSKIGNGKFHMVFCRNMLYYLNKSFRRQILENIHSQLEEGGVVVVSRSESLMEYSEWFEATPTPGYYRAK